MKIYFLHSGLISFVRKDLEILESEHEVRSELNHGRMIHNLPINYRGVQWADLVFCWFGSVHFLPTILLARAMGKPVVVVAGGYDVVDLPEIDYGAMRSPARRLLGRRIFALADHVICISKSNYCEARHNGGVPPSKLTLVYHGFPPLNGVSRVPKQKLVLTVGEVSWNNLKRKGLEDFVLAGRSFPEVPFKLVGKFSDRSHDKLEEMAPPNVEITGFVKDDVLERLFREAKVYVQASRHEGFGCSVAEAMLYDCIPVVSDVFALPEVVAAETGLVYETTEPGGLEAAISSALQADESLGVQARRRIESLFPLEQRRRQLLETVGRVRKGGPA